jgi:radical SAM protein with 4Fe4S-binding SPASM domain
MNWGNEKQKKMKLKFLLDQYAFFNNEKISTVVPYPPDQIDLDISNRCNLKCITCFHSVEHFRPVPDMTLETFRKVLVQAEGISSTITFGNHGEPFLHKDILTMIKEVKERGFFLNVINNGTLLNEEKAQALIDCGVDRVSFSLDSVDPEIYPKIRKGAKLKKTLSNILNFIRLNYEQGLKIFVNISSVNSQLALSSKVDIREFFSKLPVHVLYISDILNFHDMLAIREETKFVQRGYEKITDPKDMPICLNGFDRILIRPNGNVSLCPIDWDCVHILGNIHDAPYHELWNNEKAQQFRNALITRDYSPVEQDKFMCSRCDGKWVQDVRLRPQAILTMIAEDLHSTKNEQDKKLMESKCSHALEKAIAWVDSLTG